MLIPHYPFNSHFLNLPCGNLHYLDEGEGDPILMVHGNPTWSYFYRNLVQTLRENNRTIAVDHLGCGLSDKPQDYSYSLKNHIENLVALIDFLSLKNITLIVHDWGGPIGLGALLERKSRFKKVVLLNTAAFVSSDIPKRINLCRNSLFGEFLVRKFNLFAWPATFMTTKKRLGKEVKKAYLLPYNSYENRIAVSRFVEDIPLEENHPSREILEQIESKLGEINLPTLILWGGRDFCFHQGFYKRWREIFPQADSYYFENAGHYILEDEFIRANELIHNFL